ncbi:alpha/beta fold hydrolase [Piscinibacter sakaiensis]|uniref:alpha/beta fold hydrolase n=1 Tax=Piscinibacter sakaiensis TaxID=1547922 RepID=UPI00372BE94C
MPAPPDRPDPETWSRYEAVAERLDARFAGLWRLRHFRFRMPEALQHGVPPRQRRDHELPAAWLDWGPPDAPVLACVGGVANVAMRFAFLAADLRTRWRVVCMDWVGRGHSGWLADESEYHFETYVEQLRQWLDALGASARRPVALLGSSLGGSVAMRLAAREPQRIARLVLNDIGPALPRERRQRRAEVLARLHVFRSPAEITRRIGAAQKHDGPATDDIRLFLAHHQTRWSPENGGRVYRHDLRALQAYRRAAEEDVDQWTDWGALPMPVLLMHGMESDALTPETLVRMQALRPLSIAHVPQTGHTPLLADRHQTATIGDWLADPAPTPLEWSVPLAPPRRRW